MKLTTYLYVAPVLRMSGTTPLLPPVRRCDLNRDNRAGLPLLLFICVVTVLQQAVLPIFRTNMLPHIYGLSKVKVKVKFTLEQATKAQR